MSMRLLCGGRHKAEIRHRLIIVLADAADALHP